MGKCSPALGRQKLYKSSPAEKFSQFATVGPLNQRSNVAVFSISKFTYKSNWLLHRQHEHFSYFYFRLIFRFQGLISGFGQKVDIYCFIICQFDFHNAQFCHIDFSLAAQFSKFIFDHESSPNIFCWSLLKNSYFLDFCCHFFSDWTWPTLVLNFAYWIIFHFYGLWFFCSIRPFWGLFQLQVPSICEIYNLR